MTSHDDIAALRKRLAKTESDRDTWRAAGPEEKYPIEPEVEEVGFFSWCSSTGTADWCWKTT